MQINQIAAQIPPDVLEELKKYEYSYIKDTECTSCQYTGVMGLKRKVSACKPITIWIATIIGALMIIAFLNTPIGIIIFCVYGVIFTEMLAHFTRFQIVCPKCDAEQVVKPS
ncbi:hypothetical protein [Clostridium aceticum]|nr:hypothetical protein [Clostridium aceticum]KJF26506.1 hypothetical protein TZ02_13365 [Clostridium aceticum]